MRASLFCLRVLPFALPCLASTGCLATISRIFTGESTVRSAFVQSETCPSDRVTVEQVQPPSWLKPPEVPPPPPEVAADPDRSALYYRQHPQENWDGRRIFLAQGCGHQDFYMCDVYVTNDDGSISPTCQQQGPPASKTVENPVKFPAGAQWATSVVAYSSQFGAAAWSAQQALGAPNTYPSCGDLASAWATQATDAPGEYITVAYAPPVAGSAVWIVETLNPDAVARVTLSTATNEIVIYDHPDVAALDTCASVLQIPTGTGDPVRQIRVDLMSEKVPGWNEIDAIGVVP
jgi:hypothetical protein